MMFAVLGYQVDNADVTAAFSAVSRHLRLGGLFMFDVWYGPAVLTTPPKEKIRILEKEGRRLIRLATPELDIRHHRCSVSYRHLLIDADNHCQETVEKHHVRFFFPLELELFLHWAGMDLLTLTPFPQGDGEITEETWNVFGIARRTR
jgi:hypothetical protein